MKSSRWLKWLVAPALLLGLGTATTMLIGPSPLLSAAVTAGGSCAQMSYQAASRPQVWRSADNFVRFLFTYPTFAEGWYLGMPINVYESDPDARMKQLLNESEDLRQIVAEWRQFWLTNQPSDLTFERVHGDLGP